jgi:hypothetical protein
VVSSPKSAASRRRSDEEVVWMIRILSDLPDNVIGAEAVGHIEASDYREVLEPAVAAALKEHGKLRLVFVLGEESEGYSTAASWEDAKIGIGHWGSWERVAVVTNRDWITGTVRALSWMLPGRPRREVHRLQ